MARNQLFLKSKNQWYLLVTYIVFLLHLSGCESDNFSDITEYETFARWTFISPTIDQR